jgi:hypothetical protein
MPETAINSSSVAISLASKCRGQTGKLAHAVTPLLCIRQEPVSNHRRKRANRTDIWCRLSQFFQANCDTAPQSAKRPLPATRFLIHYSLSSDHSTPHRRRMCYCQRCYMKQKYTQHSLFEKLTVVRLIKKLPTFYGTGSFIPCSHKPSAGQ